MIKLVFCARRRSDLSLDQFRDYWLNQHGPLIQRFAREYRILKYVQSHTMDTSLNENLRNVRGLSEAYDGIAELWWESEEEFMAAIRSEEGQKLRQMFLEDESRFIDLSRSSAFFTIEHALVFEGVEHSGMPDPV